MRVAIIGGGYAGMAAAVSLTAKGIPVSVFEAADTLGGRARSLSINDLQLDNGQHILIGAYRETLRLIELVCPQQQLFLRMPLQLAFFDRFQLRCPRLPAPWHLLIGLLTTKGLAMRDRFKASAFMLAMRRQQFRLAQDQSVFELLTTHQQTNLLIQYLWEPLCLAALNTPIKQASAQVFLNVLRDSLNGKQMDSDLLIPSVDLSRLFPQSAAEYVTARGGAVFTHTPIHHVSVEPAYFLIHTPTQILPFSHVICAVSPHRLSTVIQNSPQLAASLALTEQFTYEPIYTVYLHYPHSIQLPAPMIGIANGLGQWVFDREKTHHQTGFVSVIISAQGPHQKISHAELGAKVHQELAQFIPNLARPIWTKVIAEKRATFACTPNLARPEQKTSLVNFYLAGDYTAGDYPATIEGAVRSGVKCAQLILES